MISVYYLISLAFFILKMLGNVGFFLEKFEMVGTKKAQFQAFYGMGTV
jgi:hypothetical protein